MHIGSLTASANAHPVRGARCSGFPAGGAYGADGGSVGDTSLFRTPESRKGPVCSKLVKCDIR